MDLNQMVEKIKETFPILGAMRLSKEDGSVLENLLESSENISDIGAFLGSAGDVIFKKFQLNSPVISFLKMNGFDIVLISEKNEFILFKVNGDIDLNSFYDLYQTIKEESVKVESPKVEEKVTQKMDIGEPVKEFKQVEEEDKLGEIERKLLLSKVLQLNYLIDEFSQSGDRTVWNNFIKEYLKNVEILEKALDVGDRVNLKPIVSVEINRDEIQRTTKIVIDGICKKAVEVYGASEAKKMVQNVIEKLSKR